MSMFRPGSHGSTFGGNPLGSAIAIAALDVIKKEKGTSVPFFISSYFLRKCFVILLILSLYLSPQLLHFLDIVVSGIHFFESNRSRDLT